MYVALYFVAILGLNILTGYTGQISIGHGGFMAIGGYTTALLSHYEHWNLILTLPASLARHVPRRHPRRDPGAPALGRLSRARDVRVRGVGPAAAAQVLEVPRRLERPPRRPTRSTHLWLYVVSWSCAGIAFVLAWLLLRGRIGRAFRAVRDSEVAAASSGVALPIYKTLAFGVSAAFAGVAGSLLVLATNGFAQPSEFGVLVSLQILIGAAVAGLGSLWGVIVGAVFVGAPALRLGERAAHRLLPRPGRRLRPDRDPRHAPAPERGRRAPPAL